MHSGKEEMLFGDEDESEMLSTDEDNPEKVNVIVELAESDEEMLEDAEFEIDDEVDTRHAHKYHRKVKREKLNSFKWFDSELSAKEFVRQLELINHVKFSIKRRATTDLSKISVHWTDDDIPYISLEMTSYAGIPKPKDFSCISGCDLIDRSGSNIKIYLTVAEVYVYSDLKFQGSEASWRTTRQYTAQKMKQAFKKKNNRDLTKKYLVKVIEQRSTSPVTETSHSIEKEDEHTVQWTSSYSDALEVVQDYEISTNSKFIKKLSYRLSKKRKKGVSDIKWDKNTFTPYFVEKQHQMECHRAMDRNKKTNDRRRSKKPRKHPDNQIQRRRAVQTKKVDCSALVYITEVVTFPQFKLSTFDLGLVAKSELEIRQALETNDTNLVKEPAFLVRLPSPSAHTGHTIGEVSDNRQFLDKRIIRKIHELVNDGISGVKEIGKFLQLYVVHELFNGQTPPEPTNKRFFPANETIRNHYNLAITKRKQANLNQNKTSQTESSSPDDKTVFRPYVAGATNRTNDTIGTTHDENGSLLSDKQTLLFVHQFGRQRRLLLLYGRDLCVLDASFKTFKHPLPLFFLWVKTKAKYEVVATFIVQNETEADISEVLEILKLWNPLWSPSLFMIDKSEAATNAIECAFPGIRIVTSDFSREQAWNNWTKQLDNNIWGDSSNILTLGETFVKLQEEETSNTNSNNDLKEVTIRINGLLNEIRNASFDVESLNALLNAEVFLKNIVGNLSKTSEYDAGVVIEQKSLKRKSSPVSGELPGKSFKSNRFASPLSQSKNEIRSLENATTLLPSDENIIAQVTDGDGAKQATDTIVLTCSVLQPLTNENDESISYSQFTPSLSSFKECDLTQTLLKNGPHSVSLLQLKSIEPVLSRSELKMLKACDQQFNTGWLYDEIINSFLWCICKENEKCLYVSSMNTLILAKGGSISKLWENIDLREKTMILMPWNPSGSHWILLVVNLPHRTLIYLDPMEQTWLDKSPSVKNAKILTDTLLLNKFGCSIVSVETMTRTIQEDLSSCGVFVCMYAKLIANGEDLCPSLNYITGFRKEIFDTLSGNCIRDEEENK